MIKNIKLKKILIISIILLVVIIIFFIVNYLFRNIFYKKDYEDIVNSVAEKYELDKDLIFAVIKAESNFDKDATSNKNAKGLMQLLETTAKDMAKKEKAFASIENLNLHNPEININLGTKYLSMLIDKYNGDTLLALAAYNSGMGNVDNWVEQGILIKDNPESIENIPYGETRAYVKKVSKYCKIYSWLYK